MIDLDRLKSRVKQSAQIVAKHSGKVISLGNQLAQLRDKPSVLNVIGVASTLLVSAVGGVAPPPGLADRAAQLAGFCLQGIDLFHMLASFRVRPPRAYAQGSDGDWECFDFYGIVVMGHPTQMCTLRVGGDLDTFRRVLRDHIWSMCNGQLELSTVSKDWGAPVRLRAITPALAVSSEKAVEVWRRVEPFIKAKRPRSVLIDGRPGTGKSTIVRWLAEQVEGHKLRIPSADLGCLRPAVLCDLVRFLGPSVIMVDDFDRTYGATDLLDFFEQARDTFSLLLVTTNSLEHIDPAVIRPRRFDELLTVDSLGDNFVRVHLGPALWSALSADHQEAVLKWPAAYLDELKDRMELIPGAVLADEVTTLGQRLAKRAVPSWLDKLMAAKDKENKTG